MSQKTLLALHGNGVLGLDQIDNEFNIIHLYNEKDPEGFGYEEGKINKIISDNKNDIVAINCTVGQKISESLIKSLPNLEIITTFSVGYDHIDVKAAQHYDVKVTNTPDVLSAETADTGMALLLAVSKRVVEGDVYIRVGKWLNGDMPLGFSLTNKKVGIIGLGGIGSKVAKRCEAFEMQVSYYGPRKKPEYNYPYYDDIQKIAEDNDFLILCCPGGEATNNLIDANVLDALGKEGILINIARGSVVDEPALIYALQNNIIKSAGLDVFIDEPHVNQALISMDNVVLLPHIGSATIETRTAMGQLVIDNIKAHFAGHDLLTPVTV